MKNLTKDDAQLIIESLAFRFSECSLNETDKETLKNTSKLRKLINKISKEYEIEISDKISFPKYSKKVKKSMTSLEKYEYKQVEKLCKKFPGIKRW